MILLGVIYLKLIASKNFYQTNDMFLSLIKEYSNSLYGVALEVVQTKDAIPIVITLYESNDLNDQMIKSIQTSNLRDIKDYNFMILDKALEKLNYLKDKVIIKFTPLPTTPYAQNIEAINKSNQEQVDNLFKVLDKHKNLDIYLATVSHNIIYNIKKKLSKIKIGVILTPYETNYIDVDFYMFSPQMLSYPILTQQMQFNKEVIITSKNCEDMMLIYNFFSTFNIQEANIMINTAAFMSDYPLIIYKLLMR